jgi:hypothetical protein
MTKLSYPYVGEEPSRALSPDVWKYVLARVNNGVDAYHNVENFDILPVTAINAIIDEDDDKASVTIVSNEVSSGNILRLAVTAGDDNEEVWIRGLHPVCNINPGKGAMAIEFGFRTSSITDDYNGIIAGLVDAVTAGSDKLQIVDTGLLATALAGVTMSATLATAGETLRGCHADAAVADTVAHADIGTMVAAQWHKAAITFDGNNKVSYWFDGELGGSVDVDGTNFPQNRVFYWALGAKVGSTGGAVNFDIDWIESLQLKT